MCYLILHPQFKRIGLREFPEVASFLLLATGASSKQYCLRRPKDDELYCVGKQEKMSPEIL
jgi:hypothetical protein